MKLALAGDTMLGRGVAEALRTRAPTDLFSEDVVAAAREADLFVLNLECCISERGERWPDPRKPFFFRAPPAATEVLTLLGVDAVTLANNHALDFGVEALTDTFAHLDEARIAWVGAGPDLDRARSPVVVESRGTRLGVVGFTDHPSEFAATRDRPGVAYADLRNEVPDWLTATISSVEADVVLATPHWGPNMTAEPVPHVRTTGPRLLGAGVTFVAGHSAHVFHGVSKRIAWDLGDFIDDYAVEPRLRNDLGLLFFVEFEGDRPVRLEALPLALDFCHTRAATGDDAAWITRRFRSACDQMGTEVRREGHLLVVDEIV